MQNLKYKTIVHVIPTIGGGGAEILLGHIALEQVEIGHEVHFIILEDLHFTYPNYPLKSEIEEKISIHKINVNASFSIKKNKILFDSDNFESLIRKIKPNVIHSHLYISEIYSRNPILNNIKYISHCHDNMIQFSILSQKSTKRKIIDYLETKWLLKQYKKCDNTFIAISNNTHTFFKKVLPKSLKKNIILLPNAINIKLFSQEQKQLNNSHVRLLNVGNLVTKKGHLLLIDVFHHLVSNSTIKFKLDILGFGPLQSEIEQKINQLGLNDSIKLHGNVANVADFMKNADIYVHTASYEPFGMVLIEAMASGLPIVSTNGKGNMDIIQNGVNGYMINNRKPLEIATKVIEIAENANLFSKMSKNAITFSKNYDIVTYVKNLEKIYNS